MSQNLDDIQYEQEGVLVACGNSDARDIPLSGTGVLEFSTAAGELLAFTQCIELLKN